MRSLLAVLACGIGVVSILLTGRYGYKQADLEVDRWIAAIMFGSISLCAFFFDAVAVKLWFRGARRVATFIGIIAALAFVVTFSNSLGGIVSRADVVQAQRQDSLTGREDRRRELKRLERAIEDLGKFTPTDEAAVAAARRAADAATTAKERECGNGEPKQRGRFCRDKEDAERTATEALAKTTAAKAATDTSRRYEGQIAAIKAMAPAGEVIGSANSLGATLARILGSTADTLTAGPEAVIALVFELCLVGLMVGHTTLGEVAREKANPQETKNQNGADDTATIDVEIEAKPAAVMPARLPAAPRPILIAANTERPAGSIPKLLTAALEPAAGERVEMADVYRRYRMDCAAEEKRPLSPDQFVDPLARFCKVAGIRTKTTGAKVYLMNVRLVTAENLLAPTVS